MDGTEMRIDIHLEAVRRARNLTVKQVAKAAGMAYTRVWRIEHGQCKVTLDDIGKLARGLRVPPSTLFTFVSYSRLPRHHPAHVATEKNIL